MFGPKFRYTSLTDLLESAATGNAVESDEILAGLLLKYEEIRSHADSDGKRDEVILKELESDIASRARALKLIK
jgi:hypothetical protein